MLNLLDHLIPTDLDQKWSLVRIHRTKAIPHYSKQQQIEPLRCTGSLVASTSCARGLIRITPNTDEGLLAGSCCKTGSHQVPLSLISIHSVACADLVTSCRQLRTSQRHSSSIRQSCNDLVLNFSCLGFLGTHDSPLGSWFHPMVLPRCSISSMKVWCPS